MAAVVATPQHLFESTKPVVFFNCMTIRAAYMLPTWRRDKEKGQSIKTGLH